MKTTAKISAILLAAATCLAWPAMAQTETTPPATNATPATPRPPRAMGFRGVVASIDRTAMTLTLKGRTNETIVKVTSTTKVFKDGEPGQFSDAVQGVRVTGSGRKAADGAWTANTLRIMTKPRTRRTAPPPAAGQ